MKERENIKYDVIIIGAGVAGLSAALWCNDLKLSCYILEYRVVIGGQLNWIFNPITNHLGGIEAKNGRELRELMEKKFYARNVEITHDAAITEVDLRAGRVTFYESGYDVDVTEQAASIIIATGTRRRQLNAKGESEFRGRGVYDSGTGEKNLIAGKRAVVIGGGDAAAENALLLAEVCPHVALIHRGQSLRARAEFIERLAQTSNIEVLLNTVVTEICGEDKISNQRESRETSYVKSVSVKTPDKETSVDAEAVLVRIGYQPNTEHFEGQLALDEQGYIKINSEHETSIQNVFAIGDVSNPLAPTISGAIGAGATVAKVIEARMRAVNRDK